MEKDEIGIAKRVDLRIQNPVVPGWTVQLSETELSNPHRPETIDPG